MVGHLDLVFVRRSAVQFSIITTCHLTKGRNLFGECPPYRGTLLPPAAVLRIQRHPTVPTVLALSTKAQLLGISRLVGTWVLVLGSACIWDHLSELAWQKISRHNDASQGINEVLVETSATIRFD